MIHHTRVADVAIHASGWVALSDDVEVTALPVIDRAHKLPDGTPLFARLNYDEALSVAALFDASLISSAQVDELRRVGIELKPYLGTPQAENAVEHSERHDADIWRQLRDLGWNGIKPVMGVGKHWIAGAPEKRSRLKGWDRDGAGPGKAYWQEDAVAHNRQHFDDGTTTVLVRRRQKPEETTEQQDEPMIYRPTIRRGTKGDHVKAWQKVVAVTADGDFGSKTEAATIRWQTLRGLVADGIVGAKSWAAAGEHHVSEEKQARDPRAGACRAALRDANLAWPTRSKISDGIMGDAAHQARPSDHNLGNAVDITHDPRSGCDAAEIAALAIEDDRVTYVISNGRIFNRARADEGWRKYTGSNAHTHHVHISVRADMRDDDRPWPWAPGQAPP